MDFSLTEEQQLIKKSARDFLATNCPKSFVKEMENNPKGYTDELWQKMAGLGWTGFILPQEYGGSGGNFLDMSVLLEEMGAALLPGPFFSTSVLGSLAVIAAGTDKQKADILPRVAQGRLLLTLALQELDADDYGGPPAAVATPSEGGYSISGAKVFVPDAQAADIIICAARIGLRKTSPRIGLFLIDAGSEGLTISPLQTIARDKQSEVVLNSVKVPKDRLLGSKPVSQSQMDEILCKAAVAKSMEMLGAGQRAMETAVEYSKTRVQFDQPIGQFEVIQHYCANMFLDVDRLRFLAYRTAWLITEGRSYAKEAHMTKAFANEAYRRVVVSAVQIHGGAGIITEGDMQLYYRRQTAAETAVGDGNFHRERVAVELGL